MKKNEESLDIAGQSISYFQGAWNQVQGDALNQALNEYSKGIKDAISQKNGGFTSQTMDVQQGFAAEAHHAGSFNIEAAAKGHNNHRATLDVGMHNDPVADRPIIKNFIDDFSLDKNHLLPQRIYK